MRANSQLAASPHEHLEKQQGRPLGVASGTSLAPFIQISSFHDRDTRREHREIMQAAIGRDIPKPTALLTEHLKRTARIVTRELTCDGATMRFEDNKLKA